ncbi:hypothetical protein ACWDRR_26055 [Kitasatospora sp. NPDC003701]
MPQALQIDPDGTVEVIALPDDRATRDRSITSRLSGPAAPGCYHRQATMHLHGNGQHDRLPDNPIATALACVWRGLDIAYDATYFLPGRVVITSVDGASDLAPGLVGEALAVAEAVHLLLADGRTAPWGEVLRAAGAAREGVGRGKSA